MLEMEKWSFHGSGKYGWVTGIYMREHLKMVSGGKGVYTFRMVINILVWKMDKKSAVHIMQLMEICMRVTGKMENCME